MYNYAELQEESPLVSSQVSPQVSP